MGCGAGVVRSPVRRGGQSFAEQLSSPGGGWFGGSNTPAPLWKAPPPDNNRGQEGQYESRVEMGNGSGFS